MKKFLAAVLAAITLIFAGCAQPNGYKEITQEEAAKIMQEQSGFIILDVRTAQENVPNESITDKQPEQLPDKNQMILVYCRSGRRSKQAAQKLVDMGYTNILEFGGINTWQGETTAQ